jgi:AcrR family transcriptional regulator
MAKSRVTKQSVSKTARPRGAVATAARVAAPRARSTEPQPEPSRGEPEELARIPQQERGQRRMTSILDAAEQVFTEVGVDAATTNAIAERAGASVGSIYHFFPSKDAILLALAERYAEQMRALNAQAMPLEAVHLPVDELFDRVIFGHMRFTDETPAFGVVTDATTRKYGSCAVADRLDAAIMGQVRTFLAHRLPKLPAARREAATRLSVSTIGEVVESTVRLPRAEREAILRELKEMMVRYFQPLDREYGPPKGSAWTE